MLAVWAWVMVISPDGKGGVLVPRDFAEDLIALNLGWHYKEA